MDVLVPHRTRPWTSLRFGHGCSARTDGVGVHVSVVRAETLCENTGRRDVFCARSARHTVNTCSRSPQGLILAKPRKHRQARGFRRRTRRNAVNTDALVVSAGRVYRPLLPLTRSHLVTPRLQWESISTPDCHSVHDWTHPIPPNLTATQPN